MHIGGVRYYQIFRLLARYINIYSYLKFSNYEGDYLVTALVKLQLQWNLDITNGQVRERDSEVLFICLTISGVEKIVSYTDELEFVISSLRFLSFRAQ